MRVCEKDGLTLVTCDSMTELVARVRDGGFYGVYPNLTNGAEVLPYLSFEHVGFELMRVPSTLLERKRWDEVANHVAPSMLMRLAWGEPVAVIDFGAHHPVPRALWQGMPLLAFRCMEAWGFDTGERPFVFSRGGSGTRALDADTARAMTRVTRDSADRNTLNYYRRFAVRNVGGRLRLTMFAMRTDMDGNYGEHERELWRFARTQTQHIL